MQEQGDGISSGEIYLKVPSKNMARQILDVIKNCDIPDMKAKLLTEGQEMTKDDMKAFIAQQIKDMQIKADKHIAEHLIKTENVEIELNVINERKGLKPQEYEKLIEGQPALQSKKEELQLQLEEFQYFMEGMKQRLGSIDVSDKIKEVVREIRNAFGWECHRFHNALPMYARRRDVISTVNDNQVSIILGETGSGKSTQIAQYLYQVGYSKHGVIVCTQPRKVAAISLARHVAQELGSHVGQVVGYQVGMQAKKSKETGIVFVTDHILLNECLKDSNFFKYSCIIIDEAHERSIYTDLLLGMIKKCLAVRNDLKVVITSATIDPQVFMRYFNNCPVLKVSGRMFPVEQVWRNNKLPVVDEKNYLSEAVAKAKEVHKTEPKGDILVFLTTPLDTERACKLLESDSILAPQISSLQLHGRLQSDEQQKVFDPPPHGKRKIVFATNSAETSITIAGIKYVIDSGLTKEMRFDPKRNISVLMVRKINKSSAEQRKGRAGRVESGKCFRLYTEDEYKQLEQNTLPEILRVNLAQALLKLMELGVSNIGEFDFVESPSKDAIDQALHVLNEVGALSDGYLSDTGKQMSKLPLEPRLAKIVLRGLDIGLGFEAIVIAAICSVSSNLFFRMGTMEEKKRADKLKTQFCEMNGDVLTLLNVFREWNKVDETKKTQWCQDNSINAKSMRVARETISDLKTTLDKDLNIQVEFKFKDESIINDELPRLLLEAFPSNLGYFSGHEKAGYLLGRDETSVHLHPGSALYVVANFPQWIVFEEVLKLSQDYMLNATPVKEEWVREMIKTGKIKIDIESLENKVIKPISIKNIGPYIMKKKLIGAKFTNLKDLESQMKKSWPDSLLYLEPKFDEGLLQVFVSTQYHSIVQEVFEKLLVPEKKVIQRECLEKSILPNVYSNVKIVIEKGGITRNILMADEFRGIIVCSVPTDKNVKELLQRFRSFGNIEDHIIFDKRTSQKKWGKIIYQEPECAKAAFNNLHSEELTLQIDGRPVSDRTGQELKTRVIWCRRPLTGFVFVDFKDPEDLAMVSASTRQILINGTVGTVSRSKKNDDELFIRGINTTYTEAHIREAIYTINPAVGEFKIKMPRKSEPLPSEERMLAYKRQLNMKISHYSQNSSFEIELLQPRSEKDFDMVAFVKFTDIDVGMEVIQALDHREEISGSILSITPLLRSSLWVPKEIFNILEKEIDQVTKNLEEKHGRDLKISKAKKLKSGHFAIDISAEDTVIFAKARKELSIVIQGEVVDLGDLRKYIRYLFNPYGQLELEKINNRNKVCIKADSRLSTVTVYGSAVVRRKGQAEILNHLKKYESSFVKKIMLRGDDKPPGVMKALLVKYGIELENLIKKCKLNSVELVFRQHELYANGNEKAFLDLEEEVNTIIEHLKFTSHPLAETIIEDCPICLCPVEGQIHRLEFCGHGYCKECLISMIAHGIRDKSFPISCEECREKLVIKDFTNILENTNSLVCASLDQFVAQNKDLYKYCVTRDCPVVYRSTENGKVFLCPGCSIRICTSCHTQFHDMMSCTSYKMLMKNTEDDEDLVKWLNEDKVNRGICPKCGAMILKDGGCMHMECSRCHAHICWLCKKDFQTSGACNVHMGHCRVSFN
ncbi:unnamed protein product, partial [Meganyctiphanes norvegica]